MVIMANDKEIEITIDYNELLQRAVQTIKRLKSRLTITNYCNALLQF